MIGVFGGETREMMREEGDDNLERCYRSFVSEDLGKSEVKMVKRGRARGYGQRGQR